MQRCAALCLGLLRQYWWLLRTAVLKDALVSVCELLGT